MINLPWKVKCGKCGTDLLVELDVSQFLNQSEDSKTEAEVMPYFYTSRYNTVRTVSAFIEFIGWMAVMFGVSASISAFTSELAFGFVELIAMLPGLGITMSGLVIIMGAQLTAAMVDTADYTREILKILINREE